MLTVSAELMEAYASPSMVPALRVRVRQGWGDHPALRWEPLHGWSPASGRMGAAVGTDGRLHIARLSSAGALSVYTVADPQDDQAGDFDAPSGLATGLAAAAGVGCDATGDRVLVAAATAGNVVQVWESSNGGASFSGPTPIESAGSTVTAVACGIHADGSAAVLWAVASGPQVRRSRRTGTGAWGSPANWTHSLNEITGLAVRAGTDFEALVSGEDAAGTTGIWSTIYGRGVAEPPDGWTPLQELEAAGSGSDLRFAARGLAWLPVGPRAVYVEEFTGPGGFEGEYEARTAPATAYDQGAWSDGMRIGAVGVDEQGGGLAIAAGAEWAYLVGPSMVWTSDVGAGVVDVSDQVLGLEISEEWGSQRVRLDLRRDADQASPALLPVGADVWIDLGAAVEGVPEYPGEVRTYRVAAVGPRWVRGTVVTRYELDGVWEALDRWRARRDRALEGVSPYSVVQLVAQRAGMDVVSVGASSGALAGSNDYLVRTGESGRAVVRRVLGRLRDELLQRGEVMRIGEVDEGDDAVLWFAQGEPPGEGPDAWHPVRRIELSEARRRWSAVRVVGGATTAEAPDLEGAAEGAPWLTVVDRGLWFHGETVAAAEGTLRGEQIRRRRGSIEGPPHGAIEVGDVVVLSSPVTGVDDVYRVIGFDLLVRREAVAEYSMRVQLGEV